MNHFYANISLWASVTCEKTMWCRKRCHWIPFASNTYMYRSVGIYLNTVVCNVRCCKAKVKSSDLTSVEMNHTSVTTSAIIKLPKVEVFINYRASEREKRGGDFKERFHPPHCNFKSLWQDWVDHQLRLFISVSLRLIVISSLHVLKKMKEGETSFLPR